MVYRKTFKFGKQIKFAIAVKYETRIFKKRKCEACNVSIYSWIEPAGDCIVILFSISTVINTNINIIGCMKIIVALWRADIPERLIRGGSMGGDRGDCPQNRSGWIFRHNIES